MYRRKSLETRMVKIKVGEDNYKFTRSIRALSYQKRPNNWILTKGLLGNVVISISERKEAMKTIASEKPVINGRERRE